MKAGFLLFTLGTGFYLLQTRSTDDCPEDDEDTYFARIAGGLLGLTALVLGVLGGKRATQMNMVLSTSMLGLPSYYTTRMLAVRGGFPSYM